MCREARALPTRQAGLVTNPRRQDPHPPNLSRLTGGEPTLPNAQVLGEQVQGKPSPASPRRGRNHGAIWVWRQGLGQARGSLLKTESFFFLFLTLINSFLKGGGVCSHFDLWLLEKLAI